MFVATHPVFSHIPITSSTIVPGRILHGASPCRSFPSVFSRHFYCLACDGPVSAQGNSGSSRIWDFGKLVSLTSGVCETLEKMGIMMVLRNYGFNMALGYVTYCRSRDVVWPRCTSYWFPYDFSVGEVSDVPSRRSPSTLRRNADCKPIGDRILPASVVTFNQGTSLRYQIFRRGTLAVV